VNFAEEASVSKLLAVGRLSPQTRENYVLRIRAYIRRIGASPDQFIQDAVANPKRFEEEFIAFIGQVSKGSASSTVVFWRDFMKKFLDVNRVKGIDWDYINQFLPRVRKSGLDRAPTTEEIRRLVDISDAGTKCLILFLCSSEARIGSVAYLHWRDFQPMELGRLRLARVRIYSGEPEQYDSFVTPECWSCLTSYRSTREESGEEITDWTPVFVRIRDKKDYGRSAKLVSHRTLKNRLRALMNQTGMRTMIINGERHHCYDVKQAHSFRKFFKTKMEMSGVKPIITEMLMGHALGVAGSYMKPTLAEMVEEYVKAIDNLTISLTGPVK
jgi:integrase